MKLYDKKAWIEAKKWKKGYSSYIYQSIVKLFSLSSFIKLPAEYKEKIYRKISEFRENKPDNFYDLKICLRHFEDFFTDEEIVCNEQFLNYLEILLDYPDYPLYPQKLMRQWGNKSDPELVFYIRLEAKFYTMDHQFFIDLYEDIILNKKLRESGYLNVLLNGVINTPLNKNFLVFSIYHILNSCPFDIAICLIHKIFVCPSILYIRVINDLLKDRDVWNSGHLFEMIDMILITPENQLNELHFKIKNKLEYVEMSFGEASRLYHEQAMRLLDESIEMCSSTRVRVPVFKKRF